MNDPEPQQLLKRIEEGDETAFLQLYNKWKGPIFRFAWQMTGSNTQAEDITQDLFLLMIRKKLQFDPSKGTFSSFIYGVARHLAQKSLRKNERFLGFLQIFEKDRMTGRRASDPLQEVTRDETAADLRQCILSLPPAYREVIVLCELHERTYEEAATITGSAIGTVRSRLHRARQLLAEKIHSVVQEREKNKGGTPYEIPAL